MDDRLDCGRCGESLRDQRMAENEGRGAVWIDHEEVICTNCLALNRIAFPEDEEGEIYVVETLLPNTTVH